MAMPPADFQLHNSLFLVAHFHTMIIGGALSGAATATLLLRQNPGIRVLIVEKSAKLSRRVGEATVEVSAYFMGRILGLTQYLNEHHLVKQGLRFWFASDKVKNLEEASELGGRPQIPLPRGRGSATGFRSRPTFMSRSPAARIRNE